MSDTPPDPTVPTTPTKMPPDIDPHPPPPPDPNVDWRPAGLPLPSAPAPLPPPDLSRAIAPVNLPPFPLATTKETSS